MIARRSFLILINNVLGGFLGFFALRFLAQFPPESYGAYVWAFSAVGVMLLVANLGFTPAHIKRISEGLDERTANGTFFLIKLALTSLFATLVLGGLLVYRFLLGRAFTDATTEPVLYVVTGAYILLSFRQFFDTTFQAHRHTARGESVLLVDTIASVTSVSLAWGVWYRSRGGSTWADPLVDGLRDLLGLDGRIDAALGGLLIASAYLVGRSVSLLYATAVFFAHRYPIGRFSWDVFRSYRVLGLPLAFVAGLTVFYANLDRLFLGYFWDTIAVANFQIPYSILTPMVFVATAVGALLFPTISRLEAEGHRDQVRLHVGQAERYLSMILLPQLVLAFVFAREGINVFNARYVEEARTLRILLAFAFFTVVVAPARSLLLGTGQPRRLARLGLVSVAVVVVLNLVLVPPRMLGLKEEGAAIAAAAGAVAAWAYTKHATIPWTGRHYLPRGLPRQLAAALLVGVALWFLREGLGPDSFLPVWTLLVVAALSVPAYLGLLYAMGEFRAKDWRFLLDLLHIGKMADYVGAEMSGRQSKP